MHYAMTSLPSDGDSVLLFNINTSRQKSNFPHAHKLENSYLYLKI